MRRTGWGLTLALVSLAAMPYVALAGQQNGVDCDVFADGVHEVPIIVVTSPTSGATVPPGDVTLQGIAVDCHVEVGAGINRVSAYLGSRDAGGTYLGDATLKLPNPIRVLPADQYQGTSGWLLKANVPLKPGAPNDLFLYARSEMTNRETAVTLRLIGAGAPEQSPTPAPTAAPTPASPAASEVVPLASNAPAEAVLPAGAESTARPDDDIPPPPADEAPVE